MTAEVVVMNREGVALAADSFVTVGPGKVFDNASKLHMLISGQPIALMVFNAANFMDLPWAVVIKKFRDDVQSHSKRFTQLEDVVKEFFKFVEEHEATLATEPQQEYFAYTAINNAIEKVRLKVIERFKEDLYNTGRKIPKTRVKSIITQTIVEYWEEFNGYKDSFETKEASRFLKRFKSKYDALITERIRFHFDETPLTKSQIKKLEEFCHLLFTKRRPNHTTRPLYRMYSGLVFAGYGDEDLLPKCKSYIVESLICGKLDSHEFKGTAISFGGNSAAVIPFAQDDVVAALLNARHPHYLNSLAEELKATIGEEVGKSILSKLEKRIEVEYTRSIMSTIHSLQKEDLAIVAETIVNLTSFMRKVSSQLETVGGPIDVAVISRKDGFIWIKRKHYFDINYNPHFSGTH